MLVSVCIPCMNRTHDLKKILESLVIEAKRSPPVEITIVDYDSKDDLKEYLKSVEYLFNEKVFLNLVEVKNKKYYNSPHARNIAGKYSSGKYLISFATDILVKDKFFIKLRDFLIENDPTWTCESYSGRLLICKREEFISSGGYDERFSEYGPEDRDICNRLHRRGGKFLEYSPEIEEIYTSNYEKLKNLDQSSYTGDIWIKRQMHRKFLPIFEENNRENILIANQNIDWGKVD